MTRIDEAVRYLIKVINKEYQENVIKITNETTDSYTIQFRDKSRHFKSENYCQMLNVLTNLIPQQV